MVKGGLGFCLTSFGRAQISEDWTFEALILMPEDRERIPAALFAMTLEYLSGLGLGLGLARFRDKRSQD